MKREKKWGIYSALALLACTLILILGTTSLAAPAIPSGLKQLDASRIAVQIQWSEVAGTNIRYEVQVSVDQTDWQNVTTGTSNTEYSQSGLSAGKTYYFRVRSYASASSSDRSAWSVVLTTVTAPDNLNGTSLNQSNAGATSATLRWDAVPGATSYAVFLVENGVETGLVAQPTTNSLTISKLSKKRAYDYSVFPIRSVGSVSAIGGGAEVRHVRTTPPKVSGVKGLYGELGKSPKYAILSKVNVGWNRHGAYNGYFLTDGYEIKAYKKGKKAVSTTTVDARADSAVISKIKKGGFYRIKIRAYVQLSSGKKYGAWSEIWLANNTSTKSSYNANANSLTISWGKVSGATGYTVYRALGYSGKYKKVMTTKKGQSYTMKNVKRWQTYRFYVVANKKVKKKTYKSVTNRMLSVYVR